MTTIPTQLPVPSESPRDLKFNAGKIDEFVTSPEFKYRDRFGVEHHTVEGINHLAQQTMSSFGYVVLSGLSFTTGATIENPNEVLFNEFDGEYYKWTGSYASGSKIVPENSTPESTGGIGSGKWLGVGDAVLRADLQSQKGTDFVNYGKGTLTSHLEKHTAKTIINVSAFGNTGTEQNGSDEAWDNALAYAISIAPKWKNNYPNPQEWYDFSSIEFVCDVNLYPATSVGLRGTYGGTINMTIVAPDDHSTNSYLIDMSVDRGITPNRESLFVRFTGAVHCRYKCSGINLGGSASTTTEHMRVDQFLVYGIDSDASDTQKSGGHTIGLGVIVEQRQWSSAGDEDFPSVVTTGTGIYLRSHDNRLVGATVSYCKVRCLRIKGQSNRLVSGTHLYSAGKQALLHESASGNTLIDACWLDSSRLQLDGGNITITNNLIYLTENTDSSTGIITGGDASNILIKNNSFLGWSGGTPVYFGKGVLQDMGVVCFGNRYASGMINSDIQPIPALTLAGESTAGSVTLDPSTKCNVWFDGVEVGFEMVLRWSNFNGGTGDIGVFGLPFKAILATPMNMVQFAANSTFNNAVPIKQTSSTSIRFVKQDGSTIKASDSGVSSGFIHIKGTYRPV